MAYTALNLGYIPTAGTQYTATTDSSADWPSVPNRTYFYDKTEERVIYKNGNGVIVNIYSPDSLFLNDVTGVEPTHQEGLMFYANGVFNAYIDEPDITLQIGQEFWVKVRNITGADITNGQVVYISGAQGQLPTIELAQANAVSTAFTLGVATHTIENNTDGYITNTFWGNLGRWR
jgi:hypothetical protein